ncbi:MAG TPA: DUF6603 domain-containing protein [Candidatus Acidoferrales bacterium]|nr:DUF6603 domain-containing protein [Candidatus Acidoferrales bacterium]
MVSTENLQDDVLAIGVLIGLLSKNGDTYDVNLDWFKNPPSYLDAIGQHIDRLTFLLNEFIGPGIQNPPPVFSGAEWYQIPNPSSEKKTPFFIVAPNPDTTGGDLGLGLLTSIQSDDLTIDVYTYIPFFTYSSSGTKFITNDPAHPCHIGFTLTSKNPFQVGNISFSGIGIDSEIYFSATTPTLTFTFLDLKGTTIPATYTTLQGLLDATVSMLISAVIKRVSDWLDSTIGDSYVCPGDILVAADFLSKDDDGNYSLSISNMAGLTPEQIALNFTFGVMDAFTDSNVPPAILALPGGGLYISRRSNNDGSYDYGLRLAFDLTLPIGTNIDGTPTREFTLSSGSWLTNEDDDNNWMSQSNPKSPTIFPEPGITIFLLNKGPDNTLTFSPGFSLSSIGFDIAGANQTPLFSSGGYSMQGAQLRGSLDFSTMTWGAACMLNGFGLPLGSGFGSAVGGSGTNPVAQNILASGSSSGGGDKDPVNPAFSVSAAFVSGGEFVVQLYDGEGNPTNVVLVPINRALGPLQCNKLGIGWVSSKQDLSLLFDGSIQLAGLTVALQGLSIGIPVTAPADFSQYDLDLNGMGVTFAESDIEVSGTLVKVPPDPSATPPRNYTQYDGAALIKGGTFTVSALGSYAYVKDPSGQNGYTSLFVFGMYIGDLGGPAFFYVTGLAAGFGYNRNIILPDQNSVPQFPLVAAINDPTILGAQQLPDGSWKSPDPTTALSKIDQYVPPQRGQFWFAAGVRFTSFDLINSSALLVVEFGNHLEISLLGLSWMSLPPPAAPGASAPTQRYAHAELGLQVKFLPDEGFLGATAILTPNSFIIDPDCKLTGGYAFYIWFGNNPHAGEFVMTLGGYHPDFTPPAYYPTVPRLGFNWNVSSEVTISGDAYFALTPSAVMAGAGLQVLFSSGDLKAWFNAQMDALIVWAPFHYVIDISVSIGASYRVNLLFVTATVSVELGAGLTIWGPRMGGSVYIDWYIISFTISFGADRSEGPQPLDWINKDGTGFAQSLLPHKASGSQMLAAGPTVQENGNVEPSGIFTIVVNTGLITTIHDASGAPVWIVRPNNFVFSVRTEIPTTEIDITAVSGEKAQTQFLATKYSPDGQNYFVCIRPMKATLRSSAITITLTADDESKTYDLAGKFSFDLALSKTPAAKWGKPILGDDDPEPNALLNGRLFGLENVTPLDPVLTPNGANALDIDITTAYTYEVVDEEDPYTTNHLPLDVNASPVGTVPEVDSGAMGKIQSSLMNPTVVAARNGVFTTLQQFGINALTNGPLKTFAANPAAVLTGNPFIIEQE